MNSCRYNLYFMMKEQHWQMLKNRCLKQNNEFQQLDTQKNYRQIHNSHYDWWAFPLDRNSSYGDLYKVTRRDQQFLKRDQQFIQALRSNAILVCKAWGYDLVNGKNIEDPQEDQKWQDWPIRLYKMSGSLELFEQNDLLANSVKYANKLIDQQFQFSYGPKDLKPYYKKFDENGIKKGGYKQNYRKNKKQLQKNITSQQTETCQQIIQKNQTQNLPENKDGQKKEEKDQPQNLPESKQNKQIQVHMIV